MAAGRRADAAFGRLERGGRSPIERSVQTECAMTVPAIILIVGFIAVFAILNLIQTGRID
jgi:hypothetical protein